MTSPAVITGEQFRREILGWSKAPFYALVKSGRVQQQRQIQEDTAELVSIIVGQVA